MHHCSALPVTFNSYCHQMRKPRDHAPLLRAACDLQLLQPFNVKTLENEPLLRAACDLQLLLPSNDKTSKTMHHCSALTATFNSYCHQMRKPRRPCTTAPRCLRPSIAQTSKPMRKPRKPNVKNLGAACDLQFLLPSNENTSKTMHHCPLSATFNSYCHQMRKPRDHAPLLRAACDLQLLQPFNVKTLENEPLLSAACDLQLLLPSNDKTSKTMHHCSALPATCTPPPLPASGPRTLLQSTRPLSASPPAHSQPHSIWHDALHPSPGHKVAIVALLRRASRPLAKPASSLAAVDRPPAFQLPATCIQMRVPVVSPLDPLAHPVSADPRALSTHRAARLRLPAPDTRPSRLQLASPRTPVPVPPIPVIKKLRAASCSAPVLPMTV